MANSNGQDHGPYQDEARDRRFDEERRSRNEHERQRQHSTEWRGQGQSGYLAGRREDPAIEGTGRNMDYRHERFEDTDRFGSDRARYTMNSNYGDQGFHYGDRNFDRDRADHDWASSHPGRDASREPYHETHAQHPGGMNQPMSYRPGGANYGTNYGGRFDTPADRERGDRGGAGHRGKSPMNFTRSDDKLRELICERLTEHDHVDPSNVDVRVKDGEVTISGVVDDRNQRRMIEDEIEGMTGVKDVQINVRIRPQSERGEHGGMKAQHERESASTQQQPDAMGHHAGDKTDKNEKNGNGDKKARA